MDIQCVNQAFALKAYSTFANYSYRMGNPSLVVPVEVLLKAKEPIVTSNEFSKTSKEKTESKTKTKRFNYKFGSANNSTYNSTSSSKDRQKTADILSSAQQRFNQQIGNSEFMNLTSLPSTSPKRGQSGDRNVEEISLEGYMKSIDERCMQLIHEFKSNHAGMKASRCLLAIVINLSSQPVRLTSIDVKEGKTFQLFSVKTLFGGDGYVSTTHTLRENGGVAVLFGYGKLPTIVDLAHVKLRVQSTAFTALLSSRPIGTTCESNSGFSAGFIEKTLTEWWAKYVLLIS